MTEHEEARKPVSYAPRPTDDPILAAAWDRLHDAGFIGDPPAEHEEARRLTITEREKVARQAWMDGYEEGFREGQGQTSDLLTKAEQERDEARRENERLALEAATADQDWKRAERELERLREALVRLRDEQVDPIGYATCEDALAVFDALSADTQRKPSPEDLHHLGIRPDGPELGDQEADTQREGDSEN